jgi:hypothetical protein
LHDEPTIVWGAAKDGVEKNIENSATIEIKAFLVDVDRIG